MGKKVARRVSRVKKQERLDIIPPSRKTRKAWRFYAALIDAVEALARASGRKVHDTSQFLAIHGLEEDKKHNLVPMNDPVQIWLEWDDEFIKQVAQAAKKKGMSVNSYGQEIVRLGVEAAIRQLEGKGEPPLTKKPNKK